MNGMVINPEVVASIFIITNCFANMTTEEFIEWKAQYHLEKDRKNVETDMMCCCCDNINNK